MTTTARVGTPTDQELLHIDDRRVSGYDPLAQPALIKYGEYNQLPPIPDTVVLTCPKQRSSPQRNLV